MTKPFTTLNDVAQAAGMSRAQVSRALRGDPGVRPETRKRIDEIAAQLDYHPNLAARSLVSSRSSIVGLVIGDPNNPFHIQLAQSVEFTSGWRRSHAALSRPNAVQLAMAATAYKTPRHTGPAGASALPWLSARGCDAAGREVFFQQLLISKL